MKTQKLNLSSYGVTEMSNSETSKLTGGNVPTIARFLRYVWGLLEMSSAGGAQPYTGPIPQTDNTYVYRPIK